jgi:hypothetical protein
VEWISVKERLPEEEEKVLVFWKDYISIGIHGNLGFFVLENLEGDCEGRGTGYGLVTHWMPLPLAPKIE